MPTVADRVRETTSTTGTGTLSLIGAVTDFRAFSSAFSDGTEVYYCIELPGTGAWEVGIGTYNTGTLSRDTVLASSNAGALVSFAAGTKNVFCTLPGGGISPVALTLLKQTTQALMRSVGLGLGTVVTGFNQTAINATFNGTATQIATLSIILAKTSSVNVDAGMDAYCATAGKTYKVFIKRDGVTKTVGPFCGLDSAGVNVRGPRGTGWAESGLAAGTYLFELWAQNTTDNTTINVGDVYIKAFAVPEN